MPPKFTAWRAQQAEALEMLLTSPKRIKALSAPTGFGKSPVYVAWALITGLPTCIVTDSRGLQDQLMADYKSVGMVDLRGRSNYPCDLRSDYSCEEGYAARCPHKGRVTCPASQAEMRAATSRLVVTNYAKWTATKKFGQGMSHFQQVVFDEGHRSPEALAQAMQVTLHHREIEEELGVNFLLHPEAEFMDDWKVWASECRAVAEAKMLKARARLADLSDPKSSWVRQYTHLKNLCRRLATLATARPQDWVVDEVKNGYQFDPVRPGRYSESVLLLRIPSIVVVSATLRPKTLFMLGVAGAAFDFREFDSDFDPRRCPIYWIPTMRVDSRAGDLSMLWVRHDQIAAKRTDRKGIDHTISFARRDGIVAASRFSNRMLINERGEAATEIVERFKASPPGTILVSPSVGAGFDFPGRDCEWQFVCKIPFPDGRSKIVKARQDDDKEYGPYMAIQNLVQMFGRGMRSKTDQCENFIADDHMEWFLPRYIHLAPKSFRMFYRRVDTVPQPPPRL